MSHSHSQVHQHWKVRQTDLPCLIPLSLKWHCSPLLSVSCIPWPPIDPFNCPFKKNLSLSRKSNDKVWEQVLLWMSSWLPQCDPPAKCTLGFQCADIAEVQMPEHMPLLSGAGLGAETQIGLYKTVKLTLLRIRGVCFVEWGIREWKAQNDHPFAEKRAGEFELSDVHSNPGDPIKALILWTLHPSQSYVRTDHQASCGDVKSFQPKRSHLIKCNYPSSRQPAAMEACGDGRVHLSGQEAQDCSPWILMEWPRLIRGFVQSCLLRKEVSKEGKALYPAMWPLHFHESTLSFI